MTLGAAQTFRPTLLHCGRFSNIKEGLHADGMNILQNNGEQAGQSVFHFHIHVIPRYQGDQVGLVWTPGNLDENDKKEIIQKVRQFM